MSYFDSETYKEIEVVEYDYFDSPTHIAELEKYLEKEYGIM